MTIVPISKTVQRRCLTVALAAALGLMAAPNATLAGPVSKGATWGAVGGAVIGGVAGGRPLAGAAAGAATGAIIGQIHKKTK
ncbi:hypothetical protein H0I76_05090 [Limibaculum sp. M0105]|uniref:Glycine zipper domain-containing protein n=1 Tax=Thermohalobaculum xanthum TaxID=2753746 RepID=A0A8J7M535_9RHOB|nr:hypothetical protein [Thermohalobaculum xanthum]MBK0398554.1 hypothetical protein [Thermohalobaculum xanthum]